MSLISAGSISLDSTFKVSLIRQKKEKKSEDFLFEEPDGFLGVSRLLPNVGSPYYRSKKK